MPLAAAAVTISTDLVLALEGFEDLCSPALAPSLLLLLHPPVIPWLAADSGFSPQKELSLALAAGTGER